MKTPLIEAFRQNADDEATNGPHWVTFDAVMGQRSHLHIAECVQKMEDEHAPEENATCEQAINLIKAAPLMRDILIALTTNPFIDLGGVVYDVREREGRGWDGPAVTAWSDACGAAAKILKVLCP